jgi:hypothetical protein
MNLLKSLINHGINWGLPYFNDILKTLPVEIPSELFKLFKLSDLTLRYHDDYVEAGLDPSFLPISTKIDLPK